MQAGYGVPPALPTWQPRSGGARALLSLRQCQYLPNGGVVSAANMPACTHRHSTAAMRAQGRKAGDRSVASDATAPTAFSWGLKHCPSRRLLQGHVACPNPALTRLDLSSWQWWPQHHQDRDIQGDV